MKEIKFRARFRDKNGYEFWFPLTFTNHMRGEKSFLEISAEWEQLTDWEQYTGLKDKNGVEIYQNDIVKITHNNMYWVMQIKPLDCCPDGPLYGVELYCNFDIDENTEDYIFRKNKKNAGRRYELPFLDKTALIIGNIHENPELL